MKYVMKYFVIFLTIFSLFLSACESPVSLGARLSMAGPQVNIAKPIPDLTVDETDPAVRTVFNVSGTVRDDVKITIMTVTLDYWNAEEESLTRMGREWKWEKQWMIRESEDDEWQPYTADDYNPADADPRIPASPPSWSVNKNNVNWNLPVTMNRMEQGEYFITVSAWNSAGRHDSQSSAKLKIKYNNLAPSIRIINPVLLNGSGSLSFPRPPSWDEYIFDPFNLPEETSLNLMYYTNSFNDLSYRLEYSISPPTELSFEITNEHDLDNFLDNSTEEKAAYYRWKWEKEEFPPQRGIFTDRAGAIGAELDTYTKAGGRIELSDTVKNSLPRATVTPMQLVTRVKDATGLEEYKSKGWFLYLPDSDKPYPFIEFAHRVHKDAAPPADAAELATMLRGSSNFNNLAYDDDGLKELKWTVYKLKDDSLETERAAGTGTVAFEGNKKEPWPFQAQKSFGTGRFKITVTVQDIYGTWGDEYHGYFTIFSNITPTVVTPLDSPASLTTTFWGDANGNITIKGRAQIEDYDECDGTAHGVRVNDLIIAWIKPNQGTENNFRYLDANDPLWDAAAGNGSPDSYGNKIWKPSLSFVAATAGNNGANAQEEWEFSQTINYLNELGIGMPPGGLTFNDQQFRIRVLSQGGVNVLPRSSVYAFTTRGDVTAPVLEFTHIVIKHDDAETEYSLSSDNVLPVIAQFDEVKLKGTYSDDSIGQWSGLGSNRHTAYLTGFAGKWEGEEVQFDFDNITYTLDNPSGGNWETGWYTFAEHNTDPIIQLTAGLTDIGGRRGTANMVLVVETLEPALVRISSENSDGYYGDYKGASGTRYIDIYLEFNKPVSFLSGTSTTLDYNNAPHLTLNNGGEAFYLQPPGNEPYQYKITFRYFYSTTDGVNPVPIPNTTTTGKAGTGTAANTTLNVTGIVFNSFGESAWKGMSDIPAKFRDKENQIRTLDPANDNSLAMQKKIIIDKTPPAIESVTTNAAANRYGLRSQINIEVRFNEDVQVSGMTNANTYLNLTGGNLNASSPTAVAYFQSVKDSRSINFMYEVEGNQDTSSPSVTNLGVSGMTMTGPTVTDVAANPATLTLSPVTFTGVIIDTVAPAAPSISGNVASNTTYYSDGGTTFIITGIEAGNTVEYNLNYPTDTGWTAYTGTITAGTTGQIPLPINGTYQIAARQSDTAAATPNRSPPSSVIGPVRIDTGGILQRITSSLPDGSYSAAAADTSKRTVTVDLIFRIPVTLTSGTMNSGTITLNTTGGTGSNPTIAELSSAPANNTKWTFTYAIPQGASTTPNYLDVTALNLSGLTISDQYGTPVNNWLTLNTLDLTPDRKLSNQKKIIILAGRPHVLSPNPSTTIIQATNPATTGDITFNGTQLRLTFDRDIYRGLTEEKLVIRQILGGANLSSGSNQYRIPVVLSETRWSEIFMNRSDIEYGSTGLNASTWRTLGALLYEKGTNGAVEQGSGNNLVSDTTVKWVLKYAIDPDSDTIPSTLGITATMANIREVFRRAEELRFLPNDQNVSINGKILTIDLSDTGGRPLPVMGARYEWVFPNGFVQDILGTANGTGTINDNNPTGTDTDLTSATTAAGARVLFHNYRADPPVIRINKDPPTSFNANTAYRQTTQPVTTQARINSRTPNATIQFWTRFTTDNIFTMLTNSQGQFPFLSNYNPVYTRNLPQSGISGYPIPLPGGPPKQDFVDWMVPCTTWVPMGSLWRNGLDGSSVNYSGPFTIGNENYADGGMIVHIRAWAAANGVATWSELGHEAAYRSVFVYINQNYVETDTGYSNVMREGTRLNQLNDGTSLTSNLDRVWIRGSNNAQGDTTIPDFPLSRDLTKSRKAKLLTPMFLPNDGVGGPHYPFQEFEAAQISPTTTFTNDNIVIQHTYTQEGRHFWFWVTWGINVPAYIDIFYGELPPAPAATYQVPLTNLRYLIGGATEYKEHYIVFPGRSTMYIAYYDIIALMTSLENYHRLGEAFTAPPRSD